MASEVKKIYEFGKFRFDAGRLRLYHAGETVQLPPKPLETLKVLLEEKGETVGRENLLEKIWAESFVEDANLTVAVSTLRKTLSAYDDETFIQTVPRRGYRFVGAAREKIEIAEQPIFIERHAVEQLTIEKTFAHPTASKLPRLLFVLFALLGLLAAVGAFAVWQRGARNAAYLSDNAAANEAFLKGDALLQKREVCESIPYFREAVATDAQFARAHANLAAALAMCESTDEADEVIAQALILNPNLAEVWATDGFIKMFRHWDWDGAENSLRRAVALDPNSAKAHHWLGVYLSIRGRLAEAIGEMRRAIEIEPASPLYHADLGQIYYFHGSLDPAVGECRKALELDPDFFFAIEYLRDVYLIRGDERQAWQYILKNSQALEGALPESLKHTEEIFEREGYKAILKERVQILLDLLKRSDMPLKQRAIRSFLLADAYGGLGDKENALRWFEAAADGKKGTYPFKLAYIAVEPRYAFLRDDARFQAVLKKMNLVN